MKSNLIKYKINFNGRATALIIFLSILFVFINPVFSAQKVQATDQVELNNLKNEIVILKETYDVKNSATKEHLNLISSNMDKRLDDALKRIEDIQSFINIAIITIGIILPILTLIGAYFTANKSAEKSAEEWLQQNKNFLLSRMDEITQEHKTFLNEKKKETDIALKKIIDSQTIPVSDEGHALSIGEDIFTEEEKKANKQIIEKLKNKPESEYTAKDWGNRGLEALINGELNDAVVYYRNGADLANDQL